MVDPSSQAPPRLRPLDEFYEIRGTPMPPVEFIEPDELPEPYRWLLCHCESMTSRLERFFGGSLHIRVLQKRQFEEILARQVALVLDASEEPVEYGAIKINLTLFAPEVRRVVRESRLPFGTILRDFEIAFTSEPRAFFRIQADDIMKVALDLDGSVSLYGRCNVLTDVESGLPLAEVVEILPLLDPAAHPAAPPT